MWLARRWIRTLPLHGLPRGAAGGLLVQGPRVLSVLWWASHDRARGAPRGSRLAGGAVRQWVLTLPPRVRYALAWRHDLCTAVAGVLFRAVQRHLRTWAQTRRLGDARSGAIIVVQRFGGALNLNVHLHALVLEGVLALGGVSGRRPQRLGQVEQRPREEASPAGRPQTPHARWEGFDLHAGVTVPATERDLSACVDKPCARR